MDRLLAGKVDRRLEPLLAEVARVEPVIALHGPGSVGKSTLLSDFARAHSVPVIDLDDPATREAVVANVASVHTPVCVDEYQHAPEVLDALKARLNREGCQPGTAVLTGSTRQDALPRTAQALTGRLHTMTIWPLSQGEVEGAAENLLPALRSHPDEGVPEHPTSATTRAEYIDRVCAGGFPLALRRPAGPARDRWFDDCIKQSVQRDAIELARIRQRQLLRELLGRLAGRTGQVLNLSAASECSACPAPLLRSTPGYWRICSSSRGCPPGERRCGPTRSPPPRSTSSTPGSPPVCCGSARTSSPAWTRPR